MKWHVYAISPIDFGWEQLPTVEEHAKRLAALEAECLLDAAIHRGPHISDFPHGTTKAFADLYASALEAARGHGWEGDFRGDSTPRVIFLPESDCGITFKPAFIWKQDNNGTTFVVSPYPMPWLRG